MFMNEVLLHFHLQLASLYTSSDLWLNSLCFQLVDFSCDFAHVFNKEEKSSLGGHPARRSGCSSFAKPEATSMDTSSQLRWPDCPPQVASRRCRPSPPAQVHLHYVCENPTHRSARGGLPQTHWRRADQLWNEPQRSQAFAGGAHSLESLPPSVSTSSSHRKCRTRRRKACGRATYLPPCVGGTDAFAGVLPLLTE